ncbi:MAG: methyltransferase [Ilumatobacteraceae bacterium]
MIPHADDGTSDGGTSQYFDEPTVASDPVTIDVSLPDTAFTLRTDRGVFARGQLDAGTSLLLRGDPPLVADGDVLDLGCGAGPIALTMARRAPAVTVWAVDVNPRALELCRSNADANGVTTIRVALPDDVPPEVRFGSVWSNPPIRIGKTALHELLLRWLPRLTHEGVATLVVQKHLGADSLQRWLTDQGFPTERAASKAGYRLLSVRR